VTESAAHHPNRFLADLIQGMRATAEASRQTTVEQCKSDAKAYVERLQSRSGEQAIRKSADDDVTTIRERSKARVERIRQDTEQRIAQRRQLLEQELQEYNAAIELEIGRVEGRVAAFEQEVSQFFEQLLQGADPTTFATMASQVPDPPEFQELDRQALANELRSKREEAARAEAAASGQSDGGNNGTGAGAGEQLPDFWWLDSPATLAARNKPEDEA
jgi:hypothetical protein